MPATRLKVATAIFTQAVFIFGLAHAEETKVVPKAAETDHALMNSHGKGHDMMKSMNMDNMMGMMHECMQMHKDGKMCNDQTMNQCQEKMGKAECSRMMTEMSKKGKPEQPKM